MTVWIAFLIQLLNIAGTGPIFGALMGAVFGPVVFLWIVFGSILGGAVHDYMSGMISDIVKCGDSLIYDLPESVHSEKASHSKENQCSDDQGNDLIFLLSFVPDG